MLSTLSFIISILSYLVIAKLLYSIGYFIYKRLRPRKNHLQKYGKGTWALVTAGSDGIGKSICVELAKLGFNILLAARTESKLKQVSDDLKQTYNILSDYIVVDFNAIEQTYESYCKVFQKYFDNREISILVNNVGTMQPKKIIDTTLEDSIKTVNMNCYPQSYLCRIFVEKRKEKGAIINLSSISAECIIVYHNLYGATKKFNDYLSKGLSLEYPNLDILSVRPGGVESNLSQIKNDFFTATSPENCAKGIFDDLGYEIETNGYWWHEINSYVINLLPEFIVAFLTEKAFSKILKNRKNYD
jgi:17beta-estradiol 17-dehydrogenase / very-long-chain 3-oxoacyl-CoA reductase